MATSDSTHLRHILETLDKAKARAERRKAKAEAVPPKAADTDRSPPALDQCKQPDFFVANIFDAHPKDDLASMEHPLFALRAGDRTARTYERGGHTVVVKPGYDGAATIHDKDIVIYCISQLVRALDEGRPVSRTVRFTAYDFLKATHRQTSGEGYKLLGNTLSRLRGTSIETNIETNGRRERGFFGLLDSARVIERDADDRMVAVEVTLSEWLYRSVTARQVKTISRDYFRLRSPMDRRIYELARKHIGKQPQWQVSVPVLHQKSGSRAKLFEFRRAVKALAESRKLPDMRMVFDASRDLVTFYAHGGANAQFWDASF